MWPCGTSLMPGKHRINIHEQLCVGEGRAGRGGGGVAATRPPKLSRVQSLDGGAAGAFRLHACRQRPTCSSTEATFPKRR